MKKLLSWSLLTSLLPVLNGVVYAQDNPTINIPSTIMPNVDIGSAISAIVGFLLILAAVAAFLFLIIGGIQWITSGGDKAGMEAARNRITNAIVGLIIVAAAWAVFMLVGQFIGFNILKEGGMGIPTFKNPNPLPK